jgi:hypothetical protein
MKPIKIDQIVTSIYHPFQAFQQPSSHDKILYLVQKQLLPLMVRYHLDRDTREKAHRLLIRLSKAKEAASSPDPYPFYIQLLHPPLLEQSTLKPDSKEEESVDNPSLLASFLSIATNYQRISKPGSDQVSLPLLLGDDYPEAKYLLNFSVESLTRYLTHYELHVKKIPSLLLLKKTKLSQDLQILINHLKEFTILYNLPLQICLDEKALLRFKQTFDETYAKHFILPLMKSPSSKL